MAEHLSKKSDVASEFDNTSLNEAFRKLWRSFENMEESKDSPLTVEECIALCKRLIPSLDWLTSQREKDTLAHEDLTSGELELTILPCLIAFFEDKLSVTDPGQRKDRLHGIVSLYSFYLTKFRLLHLPLPDGKSDDDYEEDEQSASAHTPEYLRAKAIANLQWQKTLFSRIEAQSSVEEDSDSARRQRAKDMLCYWVYRSRREIELAQKELKLLSLAPGPSNPAPPRDTSSLDRSVRDSLRDKVFGLGYPSAATLTPAQWFDQKMAAEREHNHGASSQSASKPRDSDSDSEEEERRRQEKIRMDDYKDTHRRGEGNTYRRG